MTDRIIGPSGGKRRRRSLAMLSLAGLLALALTLWFAIGAGAVSEESDFEDDDGNLVVDSTFDWNGFSPSWTGTAPTRTGTGTTSGWRFNGLEDWAQSGDDSAFAGGTKQDKVCPKVIDQVAPNKDDLIRVYFADGVVPQTDPDTGITTDHTYLNLAWERITQNTTSPSAHVAFEFNQGTTACPPANQSDGLVQRSTANGGDMLIVFDFEGGATDDPTIRLSRWVSTGACEVGSHSPPCWGPAATLGAGIAEAAVNTTVVASDTIHPDNPPADELGLNEFGEAGIDLTDAGVTVGIGCGGFGKAYAVSRTSGSSSTAQMKDLVGPGNLANNCGVTTAQSWIPNDTATVTGGVGGTVDFKLFSGSGCIAANEITVDGLLDRPVSGGTASTDNDNDNATFYAVTAANTTVSWRATFDPTSGDDVVGTCESSTVGAIDNVGTP